MSEERGSPTTSDEALTLAEVLCNERGWPWLEPVKVDLKGGNWIVYTNAKARGANARIAVRREDGEIMDAVYLPR